MSDKLQKILFLLLGVVLLFASYVLWSPGSFGLCVTQISQVHWFFGVVEWCEFGWNTLGIKSSFMYLGLITLITFSLSFALNPRQFQIFRNLFFVGFIVTLAFIYLTPDFNVYIATQYEITSRALHGSIAFALYTALAYLYALIKGKKVG